MKQTNRINWVKSEFDYMVGRVKAFLTVNGRLPSTSEDYTFIVGILPIDRRPPYTSYRMKSILTEYKKYINLYSVEETHSEPFKRIYPESFFPKESKFATVYKNDEEGNLVSVTEPKDKQPLSFNNSIEKGLTEFIDCYMERKLAAAVNSKPTVKQNQEPVINLADFVRKDEIGELYIRKEEVAKNYVSKDELKNYIAEIVKFEAIEALNKALGADTDKSAKETKLETVNPPTQPPVVEIKHQIEKSVSKRMKPAIHSSVKTNAEAETPIKLPRVIVYGMKPSQRDFLDKEFKDKLTIEHVDGINAIGKQCFGNVKLVVLSKFCSHNVQEVVQNNIDKTFTKLMYVPNGTSGLKRIISEHFGLIQK